MKFQGLNYTETLPNAESQYVGKMMQRELPKLDLDLSSTSYLEVGPKHGNHTLYVDKHQPQDITLVELPSKHLEWARSLSSPTEVVYTDFLRFNKPEGKQYGLMLFCGVLYHNTEQLRLLKKLRSFATNDAVLVFESATNRTPELQGKNLIEVFWPDRYRGVPTLIFQPTKLACKSMLEIAGWQVIASSDDHHDLSNPDRVCYTCRPCDPAKTYERSDVEHTDVG